MIRSVKLIHSDCHLLTAFATDWSSNLLSFWALALRGLMIRMTSETLGFALSGLNAPNVVQGDNPTESVMTLRSVLRAKVRKSIHSQRSASPSFTRSWSSTEVGRLD